MKIVAPVDAHRTLLHAVAAERDSGEQADIFEGSVVLVAIEKIRSGVVGYVKIGPAVVVVISPGCAEAVIMMRVVDAGLLRNFFEGAIALVVKEQIGFAGHAPGAALHEHSLEAAEARIVAELRQVVDIDVNVT